MPLKVSHSSLSNLSCLRKYELASIEMLQRKVTQDSRSLILGQMFHAGIAAAFMHVHDGGMSHSQVLVNAAIMGARKFFNETLIENKTITLSDGTAGLDQAYYSMMNDIQANAEAMLRHYLPSLGIGSRYRVVVSHELGLEGDNIPMIEWEFFVPLVIENSTTEIELHGFVDAVLYDMQDERYILVDWKTRAPNAMVQDEMAMLDGQLHLYASVLNQLGVKVIDTVCMYQFNTATPKPAELKKDGLPSIAACRSTWDVWYASLPEPARKHVDKDMAFWYDDFRVNKLTGGEAFVYPVFATINEDSNESAWTNAQSQANLAVLVHTLIEADRQVPANFSAHGCRSCPFKMLCVQPLRYNEPTEDYIAMFYERREGYVQEEEV